MFARTERLLLRPGWPDDADELFEAICDRDIVQMLARAPWPYRREDAARFLAREPDPLEPNFLIFRRTAGDPLLIGSCGLGTDEGGHTQIGYWIRRSHWGLGFASEAGRAVVEIARALGHRRLTAAHFIDNPASGHVLRKIGFRPTGRIGQLESIGRGGKVPAVMFECRFDEDGDESDVPAAMIRPDYDARRNIAFPMVNRCANASIQQGSL